MAATHEAPKNPETKTQDPKEVKAAVNKPTALHGVDKDGKPDQSLSDKQVERAASEALWAHRPQPTAAEIDWVLKKLGEVDEEGNPKQKFKDVDAVISAADSALKEAQKV